MTKKSAKTDKTKKPRSTKKRKIEPTTLLGTVLAGALLKLREGTDREHCRCDDDEAPKWCPLCAVKQVCYELPLPDQEIEKAELAALAAVANVVEDEDFTAEDSIEVRSALIHWIEDAADEEVEETFVEAIDLQEAL